MNEINNCISRSSKYLVLNAPGAHFSFIPRARWAAWTWAGIPRSASRFGKLEALSLSSLSEPVAGLPARLKQGGLQPASARLHARIMQPTAG
jgi:hypothetical protein